MAGVPGRTLTGSIPYDGDLYNGLTVLCVTSSPGSVGEYVLGATYMKGLWKFFSSFNSAYFHNVTLNGGNLTFTIELDYDYEWSRFCLVTPEELIVT